MGLSSLTMEKNGKEEMKTIMDSFQADTKFMHWREANLGKTEFTKPVHKDEMEFRVISGTYFRPEDAFYLMAVHTLSCATTDQVTAYLAIKKRRNPGLGMGSLDRVKVRQRLRFLAGQGMLLGEEFYSVRKQYVEIFKCTIFGHLYFKNQLGMQMSPYDDSSIFRKGMELYKRLAANSIGLTLAALPGCVSFSFHSKPNDSFQPKGKGYAYFQAMLREGEKEHIYLVEPVYFSDDPAYVPDDSIFDKFRKRMDKLREIVGSYKEEYDVTVIFAFENIHGFRYFIKEIREMDLEFFCNALYTSENVLYMQEYKLDRSFFRLCYKEDGKPVISATLGKWKDYKA